MEPVRSLSQLLSPDAEIRKVNQAPFVFLEGPVWDTRRNRLVFTDPLAQTVIFMPKEGEFQVLLDHSGYANGMCLSQDGNLAICKMDVGAIWLISGESGELLYPLALQWKDKPFNATNDVIADKKGGYYFTDPFFTYGPHTQSKENTYYRNAQGEISCVATQSLKPNGLALSPDGETLYIDDTGSTSVWKYHVLPDGQLEHPQLFCHLIPPPHPEALSHVQQYGEADGMKTDTLGNVYITSYSGIQVFNVLGENLGIIQMPDKESAANLTFGGKDRTTMYITARTSLYALDMLVPGIG